ADARGRSGRELGRRGAESRGPCIAGPLPLRLPHRRGGHIPPFSSREVFMTPTRHRRSMPVAPLAGVLSLAVLAAVSESSATTLRKMDLPELVSSADRVVYARVASQTTYWDESETQIYTDTTFDVLSEAKGSGPTTLTVTLLGGQIGDVEMREDGTPLFAARDEVVLFALERPDGKNNLVGFSQGVMRVQPEPDTGDKYAVSEVPV